VTITLPVPARPRLRPVPYEPLPGQAPARAAPVEPPPRERPAGGAREFFDAHRAATRILRLAFEVLDGKRAPMQLAPHFAPRPLRYWRAATGQRATRVPVRHGRIRLCTPRSGVAEVAVTCRVDGTYRALAARFERADGRWRCTAVRLL
jgi:uncharacterized protein DUF6459